MDMSTTNNDFNNTTQSALNLVDLNNDVLTLICEHLDMRDACNLYRTGSKNLRKAIANTKFDFYENSYSSLWKTWYIPQGVSIKKFRSVFANAIGIRIMYPYELTNEDFDYMVPKTCYGKPLEGVKIDLSCYKGDPTNSRGKYHKNAFTKLEGIHTLNISYNQSVKYRHLKSLKDIKCLSMNMCLQIPESVLQHFTKVKILEMEGCDQMTNKALTYLKSNDLELLNVIDCYKIKVDALNEFCNKYKTSYYEPDYLVDLDE
jgi:hypothetical protein